MTRVLDRLMEHAETLREMGPENERLGQLSDPTVEVMRNAGVIRLLQPKIYEGQEAHPAEFASTVMRLASLDGASGWVAGVVGVHPWGLALADAQAQEDVWGPDPEVWIASPYAPMGVARPVEGGFIFNGRWQFSSGTDHCRWIFLGALLGDTDGKPVEPRYSLHMLLPRSDYEIVPGSWDVVGLRGTGSKDIIVKDAFVPSHRVLEQPKLLDGTRGRELGLPNPIYRMPYSCVFPLGITAATIGICEGGLAHHLNYQRDRVSVVGTKVKDDPHVLYAISHAAAEIDAARTSLIENASRMFDIVESGRDVTFAERAAGRRRQVSAAWRAVRALDEIFDRSGGNAMRMSNPLQRFWRDAHTGLAHAIHVPGMVNHAAALTQLDLEPPPGPMRSMI
ncbi:putative hydroxylase [Acrocarpospora pleiomorpha]|uniref:Putative hydroxylase n=1 Tax=Acrocarpospora pleiomorpha TaxID=90975 RepID=A0A5M3Y462_9ACTN|nr:acyl-CoA dehydrogenase family protein [Acrocarpospora pleiomorpha]GES25768.1 putative hydroxylase [Acrocarpospora pleiomorpha]